LFNNFKSLILSRVSVEAVSNFVLTIISSVHLYTFVASTQSIAFFKKLETCGKLKSYKASLDESSEKLYSKGKAFLEVSMFIAQGILDKVFFTSAAILSKITKSSPDICNSKSAPVGGHPAASKTVTLKFFIFLNSHLNLSEISIDDSFLPYSSFTRFILIFA
jgi:hypothetical protein